MSEKTKRYLYGLMTDDPAVHGPGALSLKAMFRVLSNIYGMAVVLTASFYSSGTIKPYRPKCKVISIGNITLGGTGKTPLTIMVARRLKEFGKKTVILTRGYMKDPSSGIADEPELFKKALGDIPVIVGRDRAASAIRAESLYSPDVIILDDGFQHWRLARDLDIVAVNGRDPVGNGYLIPRGILREPVPALERADIIVVTKGSTLPDIINEAVSGADIYSSSYRVSGGPDIRGKKVVMACAIADPSSFEETVLSLGAVIERKMLFMDHHIYEKHDYDMIISAARSSGCDTVVVTEKDMVKLSRFTPVMDVKIESIPVEIKIDQEERFFGRLGSLFTGKA
ncbi:MAG: tetraacyldisaccharide 4'-kinase [Candidatus Omnitrophota bacterium]